MSGNIRYTVNMANSIIGVSILSMPYCFKESGLILGILLLLFSGYVTKKTSMYLIKSAVMSRRRSYELLAFQVFGVTGKLIMEICIILFLMGICVSFHVVMGDIAPVIVAKYMHIESSPSLRCTLLIGMVLIVILPLCLLRNLDSLASMSACSIGFYVFLNGVIFSAAFSRLIDGSWIEFADMYHFQNAFRVLPIMVLGLACQSNVFEIYYSIPDPDVMKMKSVVSQAVNLCCALYTGVGFLGYVAFIGRDIGGNVILNFQNSMMTDGIQMVFVFSLAISFPLILFPCRTSIHSLLYKRSSTSFDITSNFIPESRFKIISFSVLAISLVIGILLPNIEFVLGLLGSTMGMVIALIFPSLFFIRIYTKRSCDRLMAQGFLLLGIIFMVSGTYLHLSGLQSEKKQVITEPLELIPNQELVKGVLPEELPASAQVGGAGVENVDVGKIDSNGRKEPAIPEPPPQEEKEAKIKPQVPEELPQQIDKDKISVLKKAFDVGEVYKPSPSKKPSNITRLDAPVGENNKVKRDSNLTAEKKDGKSEVDKKDQEAEITMLKESKKEESLHPDAIKKEEKEKAEEIQKEEKPHKDDFENKQEKILKQMESQQQEQKQLIEEQKKIIQELKYHQEKSGNIAASGKKQEARQETLQNVQSAQNVAVNEGNVISQTAPKMGDEAKERKPINENSELKKKMLQRRKARLSDIANDQQAAAQAPVDTALNVEPIRQRVLLPGSDTGDGSYKKVVPVEEKQEKVSEVLKNKLKNIEARQTENDLNIKYQAQVIDSKLKVAGAAQQPVIAEVYVPEKHDEERRKRDLTSRLDANNVAAQVLDSESVSANIEKLSAVDTLKTEKENSIIKTDKLSVDNTNKLLVIGDLERINVNGEPSFGNDFQSNLNRDLKNIDTENVMYDTRQLLSIFSSKSNVKKIERRRRKHKQYPDYWDDEM